MATTHPQMLTCNRLRDGDILYWKDGDWVLFQKDGEIFTDPAAAEIALAAAQKDVTGNRIVAPYLFDVMPDGRPVKEREIIRAAGPTVQRHLGKQARQTNGQTT
ncbi:MAG TPA: DUF2849 domain-containing protein [Rhizomicrobium sp.]